MSLPNETQEIINGLLAKVRQDAAHNITTYDRLKIYQSFGSSRIKFSDEINFPKKDYSLEKQPFDFMDDHDFLLEIPTLTFEDEKNNFSAYTFADKVLCWLAIFTVEHVLFVWEDWDWKIYKLVDKPRNQARKITNTARKLMQEQISFKIAYDLFCGDFNLGLNIDKWVPYQVYSVYEAAYRAFDFIATYNNSWIEITQFNNNYDNAEYNKDFVKGAIQAYSAIDPNPPGDYNLWPDKFDASKRLEFWEWWLNEALPQAWEIASLNNGNFENLKG